MPSLILTSVLMLALANPNPPNAHPLTEIQALGYRQQWSATRWNATGDVDGIAWLETWGNSLIGAMEALQLLAVRRVTQQEQEDPRC